MAKRKPADIALLFRQGRLLDKLERPFREAIRKEKNRFIQDQVDHWKRSRALSQDMLAGHALRLRGIFRVHIERTIRVFSGDVSRNMPKSAALGLEYKFTLFDRLMQEWTRERGAEKVQEIAQTTFDDLKAILSAAIASEEPAPKIIRSMLTARSLSAWRAATIARTEIHNAAMFASKGTAQALAHDAGLKVKKKWVPALDERTRVSHAAMVSHKAIEMHEKFNVGGEKLDRPGDPAGSAATTINCRCVLTYQVELEE